MAKDKSAKAGVDTGSDEQFEVGKDTVVVWVKYPAYIDDTKRVRAGVYGVAEVPKRLVGSPAVEVIKGVPTPKQLEGIAKFAGLNSAGMTAEQILAKVVVSELDTY